jgi:hypothetical protein
MSGEVVALLVGLHTHVRRRRALVVCRALREELRVTPSEWAACVDTERLLARWRRRTMFRPPPRAPRRAVRNSWARRRRLHDQDAPILLTF